MPVEFWAGNMTVTFPKNFDNIWLFLTLLELELRKIYKAKIRQLFKKLGWFLNQQTGFPVLRKQQIWNGKRQTNGLQQNRVVFHEENLLNICKKVNRQYHYHKNTKNKILCIFTYFVIWFWLMQETDKAHIQKHKVSNDSLIYWARELIKKFTWSNFFSAVLHSQWIIWNVMDFFFETNVHTQWIIYQYCYLFFLVHEVVLNK